MTELNSKDSRKEVTREYNEKKEDLSNNIYLLNKEFNGICSNYFRSFADIQKECIEIIENNVKSNKKFNEKWLSNKINNSDMIESYLKLLIDQLQDSTETILKINEINNKITSNSFNVVNDYFTSFSKIFVANHELCKKIAKNWLSIYTQNNS